MKNRMQAKDIDEHAVLAAAYSWQMNSRGWAWGIEGYVHMGVLSIMIEIMGIPPRLAIYKLERMTDRGLLDYGTSVSYAWPTEKGTAILLSKASEVTSHKPQEAGSDLRTQR